MNVRILKAYGKWLPGDIPDLLPRFARELVASGVAEISEDQTRRDYIPKPPEPEPQPITVNNYFLAPEGLEDDDTEQEEEQAPAIKSIRKRKKK
jgi:hypothetical protein